MKFFSFASLLPHLWGGHFEGMGWGDVTAYGYTYYCISDNGDPETACDYSKVNDTVGDDEVTGRCTSYGVCHGDPPMTTCGDSSNYDYGAHGSNIYDDSFPKATCDEANVIFMYKTVRDFVR